MTSHFARTFRRVAVPAIRELATTAHAAAVLVAVEAMIRWVPLTRLAATIGCRVDLTERRAAAEPLGPGDLPAAARRRLRCAHRVADRWPLAAGPCLRRALVGGHLLRRLDPSVRLGVHQVDGQLVAHAWLEIDHRPLEDVSEILAFHQPGRQVT